MATYSAGTIFLQVVPSYRGFMESVRRQARDADKAFGEELNKGGKAEQAITDSVKKGARKGGQEAGEEYAGAFRETLKKSLRQAERELKPIKIKTDPSLQRELDDLLDSLKEMRKQADDVKVDVDADDALGALVEIEATIQAIRAAAEDIDVQFDTHQATRAAAGLRKAIGQMTEDLKIKVEVETEGNPGEFQRKINKRIEDAFGRIPPLMIDADLSSADAELALLQSRLEALRGLQVGVDIDEGSFFAEVAAIESRLDLLERSDPEVRVRAIAGAAKADLAEILLLANRVDASDPEINVKVDRNASANFGDMASNLRAFNVRLLAAVSLGPLLVPILGSLAGAALAAGSAFSAAGAGLGVMILGFSGISGAVKAINDVQKNAAKDALATSKSLRSAANGVRDAEIGLQRARENAGEAAERASEAVASALRGQERAEESLREAQEDAVKAQRNLMRARQEAQDQLEDMALKARGGVLAERQALIDLFEAEVAYRTTMADPGATNLQREQASINLERERLGIEQIRLENGRLAEEQAEVARTGIEGMDVVVRAQEGVENANDRVADAQQGVADAARAVQEAYQAQARSARDSQQAIADAQRGLDDARLSMLEAQEAADMGSASVQKLNEEMAKLGPAGQTFAIFIAGLEDEFFALRNAVQEGMLPGVQRSIENLLPFLPQITDFLRSMGTTIGDLFDRFTEFLTTSPAMRAFFTMLAETAPTFLTLFAEVGMAFLELFAVLATAFAPFAQEMLVGLRDILTGWAEYLQTEEGQQKLQDFMDFVREWGPKVIDFIGALATGLWKLGEALAPLGGALLTGLTRFFEFIAGMDPATLGAIVTGLLGMVFAFQVLAGFIGMLGSVASLLGVLFGAPTGGGIAAVLGIVVAVTALVGILVFAYFKFEWFRDFVNAAFTSIWETVKIVFEGIKWAWDNILKPVLQFMWDWIKWVWDFWELAFKIIAAAFGVFVDLLRAGWENFMNSPGGKALVNFWQDHVLPAWDRAVGYVQGIWDAITDVFKGGVRLVVSFINEGIVDPMNWLADALGVDDSISKIPMPFEGVNTTKRGVKSGTGSGAGYATGGFVAGFSPTPTADNIPAMLTAGEYILPVDAVKRLRRAFGDNFLEMLRAGLPGFARGGLVEFGRLLQSRGFRVAEHPAFGGVSRGVHAPNSLHYSGQAIDVNYGPGGTSRIEQEAIDRIIGLAQEYGLRTIWRVEDHFNHAHFDTGGPKGSLIGRLKGAAMSALKGALPGGLGFVGELLDPIGYLWGKAKEKVNILTQPLRESALGQVVGTGLQKAIGWGAGWLRDKAGMLGDFVPEGGDVPKLYDSGGWIPPGISTVVNASGRPEPVFTADQFDRLVEGGRGDTIMIPVTQQNDPEAVAEAVMFAKRVKARGGVYAGRV